MEDAQQLVADYVRRYNDEWLHSAIGYVTLADKLTGRDLAIFVSNSLRRYHFFNQPSTTLKSVDFSQLVGNSRSLEARLRGRKLAEGVREQDSRREIRDS